MNTYGTVRTCPASHISWPLSCDATWSALLTGLLINKTGCLRNTEGLSCSRCCSGKARSVTYSECLFVALVIQHAMRLRHNVTCGPSGFTLFFPHYLINGNEFREKFLNTKCVFWFSLQRLSEICFVLRRTERDMIKKCISVCMYSTGYCCQILMKLGFPRQIVEKYSNNKFYENPPIGKSFSIRTHRRTDRHAEDNCLFS